MNETTIRMAESNAGRITLLVIDDSQSFRENIQDEGTHRHWSVLASDEVLQISQWLEQHAPDVVLLDWQLPGQQRRDFARMLQDRGLTDRTLLLSSAEMDNRRRALINEFGLAGFKLKPLDLDRLEEEIRLPTQPQPWPGLEAMANQVDVCIDILDNALNPIWSNEEARKQPLAFEQRVILQWLRAHLAATSERAARRLDWDGEKSRFLESRLFALRSGHLWLARDWRAPGDRPHDYELLNIDKSSGLRPWLRAVARLLAQRYAISRFRVYKIAPLPTGPGLEEAPSPLVLPLFQSGGGFATSADAWLESGFLVEANPLVHRLFNTDGPLPPEHVDDSNPRAGCQEIRFGDKGTRRVQFLVRDQESGPVALFAIDRRLDHASSLTDFDREAVEIATRMASDEAGMLDDRQWSLMTGLVGDIGERLSRRLTADEDNREKDWHEAISRAMRDTFSEAGRSPEMTYEGLSQVCKQLSESWQTEAISGHVMGTSPRHHPRRAEPLGAWYVALLDGDDSWQSVAGTGSAYDHCRREGRQVLGEPHRTASRGHAWQAVVIQDFQRWLHRSGAEAYPCLDEDQRSALGSWLSVPMQVDGKVRGLMVAHSPHRHYFTAFRVRLMEHASKRLLPLLAAAHREARTRSAFTAAVMHEVKNDSHAALLLLEQLQAQDLPIATRETMIEIRHYLMGLNTMGQDALDVFQLGRGERFHGGGSTEQDQVLRLGELLDSMTLGWITLYETTRLDLSIPPDLHNQRIRLLRASAFRRVARVLMHNAFRHGRDWVHIRAELLPVANGDARLQIEVRNLADVQVASTLAEHLNLAIAKLGSSPLARGRLGLTVARQLTTESGGMLGDLEINESTVPDMVDVGVTLSWPIHAVHI
jgi:DNA-binding NarL/FixJ family response regulator